MEEVCPQWLTKEYLEPVIRSYEDDQTVKVVSVEVTRMAAKGNHFMSDICRAVMLIERGSTLREMALVVKIAPGSPDLSKVKYLAASKHPSDHQPWIVMTSSSYPCEINDTIQYINLGYRVQAPKIVIL